MSLAIVAGMFTFTLQSCKDDSPKKDDKPPVTTDDDNPDPNDNGKDYILFQGNKMEMINPVYGTVTGGQADTMLEWWGNKRGTPEGDTCLRIKHMTEDLNEEDEWEIYPRRAGTYTPARPVFYKDEVEIFLQFGQLDGRPSFFVTGGDYKLERVNGKWVSTLKNGTGVWTKFGGEQVTYTGIEFRATWEK